MRISLLFIAILSLMFCKPTERSNLNNEKNLDNSIEVDDTTNEFIPFTGTATNNYPNQEISVPFGRLGSMPLKIGTDTILAFNHTLIGTQVSDQNMVIQLMPSSKSKGPIFEHYTKRRSPYAKSYSTENETVQKGYYQVQLGDGTYSEITTGDQVAFHRYTFDQAATTPCLLVDLSYSTDPNNAIQSYLKSEDDNKLSGFQKIGSPSNPETLYFALEFSAPWMVYQFGDSTQVIKAREYTGKYSRGIFLFNKADTTVETKIGFSSKSIEDAQRSLNQVSSLNFEEAKKLNQKMWDKSISQ